MTTHYYLGANTPNGFYSLYDKYLREDDRLYIIKGSPGCGKSTFMKNLAKRMAGVVSEIELIHCSGDPDSLDGVYFPELHIAYVDGTSPHVIEPQYAGVRENYINFGESLDMDALWENVEAVKSVNRKYKQEYQNAYTAFFAASASMSGVLDELITDDVKEAVIKKAVRFGKKEIKKRKDEGSVKERFTDAVTCKGWVHRYDTIAALSDKIYLIDTNMGLNYLFTETLAKIAIENNWDVILCRDAFCPEKISHIILPQAGIAVVSRYGKVFPDWNARTIRLDSIPSASSVKAHRDCIRSRRKIWDELVKDGIGHLKQAKAYHDELEMLYRPHADFRLTDSLLEKHIEILKERT